MSFKKGKIKRSETDYAKIRVTPNGAFYMRSEDIFNNKTESLTLLSKLSKSLAKYKAQQIKVVAKTESKEAVNA